VYPIVIFDALSVKMKQEGAVKNLIGNQQNGKERPLNGLARQSNSP
jgi:hypothetical protein